jgi:phospholipase D-like protein/trypsin-like peptidase
MSSSAKPAVDPAKLHNWLRRLQTRDPRLHAELTARYQQKMAGTVIEEGTLGLDIPAMVVETIVREGRPALLLKNGKIVPPTVPDEVSREIVDRLLANRTVLEAMVPLVGRIDVSNFPGSAIYLGTGWLIEEDVIVTNRHVAELIARWDGGAYRFVSGQFGNPIGASVDFAHEYDSAAVQVCGIDSVIWIEPDPKAADIAFLKLKKRRPVDDGPRYIALAKQDVPPGSNVAVVGYPARAPSSIIPDQARMDQLYGGVYDIKRIAPGLTDNPSRGWATHDCTTLGGNSGSVVLDLKTGEAVGLHFAGLYLIENYAVPASVISAYLKRPPWLQASREQSRPNATPPQPGMTSAGTSMTTQNTAPTVSTTLPLTITVTVTLGSQPSASAAIGAGIAAAGEGGAPKVGIEKAVRQFWAERPQGVIAARVGYADDGDVIGDVPLIAASVPVGDLDRISAAGLKSFLGYEVRYYPANATEIIESTPLIESVNSISYDDNDRIGAGFALTPIDEEMSVKTHVGPEFSWDVLREFLDGAKAHSRLISAIYEFHAPQIKDAIEGRLKDGISMQLVLDNATFSTVKPDALADGDEFDRVKTFEHWAGAYKFERVVAPEGTAGLISDSYHIKVTVRDDDTFWLSSGNWKKGSSQPVITQAQRDDAENTDLPGNREWHVVIQNKTLADRFRNHIAQDFAESETLGGRALPASKEAANVYVDIPMEEGVVLERKPPGRILKPEDFAGQIKVQPLLTPDRQGAVFSEAVLRLIRSAKTSLLFQIPYIGMPSNPDDDRGYIDELIEALIEKLTTLDDARLILRNQGSRFSAPTHAAWHFKSKGVDIARQLKNMENTHTKGMVVDGKRVLIGSHNWSKPGVTLNRDASLIFDHEGIAQYFTQAFEIDWERARPITPKKFVSKPRTVREAVGAEPPMGFRRVLLSDLLKDED